VAMLMWGIYGGETGIRTLDTLRYTRFPSVRLQPLGHLSCSLTVFCGDAPTEAGAYETIELPH
jgi:hypothetical protein